TALSAPLSWAISTGSAAAGVAARAVARPLAAATVKAMVRAIRMRSVDGKDPFFCACPDRRIGIHLAGTCGDESYHQRTAHAAANCANRRDRSRGRRVSPARRRHYVGHTIARLSPGRRGTQTVLNRYDHRSAPGEAEIRYLDGDFRVVRPG